MKAVAWLRRIGPARTILGVLGLFTLLIVIQPQLIAAHDPNAIDPDRLLEGPSWSHPFGTDEIGEDIFARVVYATRLEMGVAVGSVLIAALVAVPAGLWAGYRGGKVDTALAIIADSILSFPIVLFAVLIVAAFRPSMLTLVGVLAFVFYPRIFRLVRGQAQVLSVRPFVKAARAIGVSTPRIMGRHILPNTMGPLFVIIPQLMAIAILIEAGLSFIGLGIQPPAVSWGTLLLTSKNYYTVAPWYTITSGAVVSFAAAVLMIAGDVAAESANPLRRA